MCTQRQGVQSTKDAGQATPPYKIEHYKATDPVPNPKKKDIFIVAYNTHDTMSRNQGSKLLHTSSGDNNYHMVIYNIYGNLTWTEPMKKKHMNR